VPLSLRLNTPALGPHNAFMDLLDAQKKTATLLLVNEYKQTNTTAVRVPSKVHIL
jgi:hypothetical protein